jgi:cell division protein ZapA
VGQINVTIGGRSYPLACRDGEEERLNRLAAHVDAKAADLQGALGQMSEPRLLLMSAILIADEFFDLKERDPSLGDTIATNALEKAAQRVEAIVAALEKRRANAWISSRRILPGARDANIPEAISTSKGAVPVRILVRPYGAHLTLLASEDIPANGRGGSATHF